MCVHTVPQKSPHTHVVHDAAPVVHNAAPAGHNAAHVVHNAAPVALLPQLRQRDYIYVYGGDRDNKYIWV